MDKYGNHQHPHTHAHMSLASFTDHIKRYHNGDPTAKAMNDPHGEEHVIRRKKNWNHATRIDVHPHAELVLEKSPIVYFGIEGCLKADSIWDAIKRENQNASVVSVPAVGMWGAPELEEFARTYLQRKTLVIVPDGDWVIKHEVEHQARVLQGRLLGLGCFRVHIAAPPVKLDRDGYPVIIKDEQGRKKPIMGEVFNPRKGEIEHLKGVDDFLGLGNGKLTELQCIDREPPNRGMVCKWMFNREERSTSVRNALVQLALIANSEGEITVPFMTIGKIMGVTRTSIHRYIHRLKDIGAIEIHGDLTTKWGNYGFDWEDRPTIQIIPELRAIELPVRLLGDVLGVI